MATIVSFHAHPDDESIATGGTLRRAHDTGNRVVLVFATLDEESPEILTIYDDNGGYGHPDHIQVHRVGKRAAELSSVPAVVQTTINRDLIDRAMAMASEFGIDLPDIEERASESVAEDGVT